MKNLIKNHKKLNKKQKILKNKENIRIFLNMKKMTKIN